MEKIDIDEIALKLNYLKETKNQIKAALIGKGIEVTDADTFRSYADKVNNISTKAKIPAATTGIKFRGIWDTDTGEFSGGITDEEAEDFFSKLDFSNLVDFTEMFVGCRELTTAPEMDTSSATSMNLMFTECNSLTYIPIYDTSNIVLNNGHEPEIAIIADCPNLNDASLNNIMQMCINAVKVVDKTQDWGYDARSLKKVGLSQTQAERCKALSNYQAFIAAGWTTGYENQQS